MPSRGCSHQVYMLAIIPVTVLVLIHSRENSESRKEKPSAYLAYHPSYPCPFPSQQERRWSCRDRSSHTGHWDCRSSCHWWQEAEGQEPLVLAVAAVVASCWTWTSSCWSWTQAAWPWKSKTSAWPWQPQHPMPWQRRGRQRRSCRHRDSG